MKEFKYVVTKQRSLECGVHLSEVSDPHRRRTTVAGEIDIQPIRPRKALPHWLPFAMVSGKTVQENQPRL